MKDNRIGEKSYNNFGSIMIINKYRSCSDIDIYFPEYNYVVCSKSYSDFKKGKIYCPYEPRVYGIGYFGVGEFKVRNENGKNSKAYTTWHDMLRRCYTDKWKSKNPTYEKCEVCNDWLNYQNFANWFYQNYYSIDNEKMNLDKDILCKYNKTYSPETCIFVPHRINNLFIRRESKRGELPIGVMQSGNKYEASYSNDRSIKTTLGLYDTPEEAFYVYKDYKEKLIKQLADKYRKFIPDRLYNAMYEYKVDIND